MKKNCIFYVISLCVCILSASCNNHNWHSMRVGNYSSQHVYITSINGLNCDEIYKSLFLRQSGYAPAQTCEISNLPNLRITFPLEIQWKSSEDNFQNIRTTKLISHKIFISEGNDIHWDLVLYEDQWLVLKQCYSDGPWYSSLMVMYEVLGIPLPKGCRQQSMLKLLEGNYQLVEVMD